MGVSTVALLGQARPPAGGASGRQEPPQGGIAQNSRTPWGRGYPGSAWFQAAGLAWPRAAQRESHSH